jgi:hypothetical protein
VPVAQFPNLNVKSHTLNTVTAVNLAAHSIILAAETVVCEEGAAVVLAASSNNGFASFHGLGRLVKDLSGFCKLIYQ